MNTKERPTIETERLTLRPFSLDDAKEVQRLAGDKDIASTTESLPHPYEDGVAEQWIHKHQERFEKGESVTFAIVHREERFLIGAISLLITEETETGELGYWIGKPYWNNDYCTESAHHILNYGFKVLGLNKIFACHMTRNPSSGRIIQKIGMKYEGCLRQCIKKWDNYEDMNFYGILRNEYEIPQ